jgi:dihydrofolate reductase
MLSLIAAYANNQQRQRVIGKDNKLPWHHPADLHRFREHTLKTCVIMGRKTHESIGRVLPGRDNFIITRQEDYKVPGAFVFTDLEVAIKEACARVPEVFIIGGGELYKQTIDRAERLYLTRLHREDIDGDAYFPDFYEGDFKSIHSEQTEIDTFLILQRVRSGSDASHYGGGMEQPSAWFVFPNHSSADTAGAPPPSATDAEGLPEGYFENPNIFVGLGL